MKIGAAIYDALADDGEDLFTSWSEQSPRNDAATTRAKWRSFRTSPMTVTENSLFWEARQTGWRPEQERERGARKPNANGQEPPAAAGPRKGDGAGFSMQENEAKPPPYSEDAVALAFSARHNGQLLYVPAWAYWLRWDGVRWARDDTLRVFDLARALCREFAATTDNGKIAKDLTDASTVAAVERLARSDIRHARSSAAFDVDPWALNTPDGVVDLRTGRMRQRLAGDLFTKATTVAPGGDCPRWLRFLEEITSDDRGLIAYLQRFVGYALTGEIREHAFMFLWGPGGNGKSVLLGTVARMLGDYATTALNDVFTLGRNDQHHTHVAALRGARMVAVTETEEGRPWAESRIKSLTGGDRISARVMRGDPFEFSPQFKLVVSGNHRPVLRNPDPAMRRRLHLVPLTFVPTKPDLLLPEKLRPELPGILAWAIEGCLAWQQDGLNPPEAVAGATAEYFAEQDAVANWIAERTERHADAKPSSRWLYTDWKAWATARGEDAGTEKRFSAELERHFAKQRTNAGMVFLGLRLLPSETGVL